MRSHLYTALRLTLACIFVTMVAYPLLILVIARGLAPGHGLGQQLKRKGIVVGFYVEGQSFTQERYFQGRPSAVNYNAGGSGASNLGPSSPDLLQGIVARADSFLIHNPGVSKGDIPADLLTASASGLDPDISIAAALVQIPRISRQRGISQNRLKALVQQTARSPLGGLLGPSGINVLVLNLKLDTLK
jgi:K+-transporting ATPase ATPase C chain